jgi:hypothetical protein
MTIKKGLENRIRGWLPHEPTMISTTRLKVNHEYEQPPPIIPPEYKASVTKRCGVYAIFITFVCGFVIFTSLDQERNPISAFQIMVWIIIGLAFGVISSLIETKYELSRVSKTCKFTTDRKDYVLIYVPIILFFIFCYIVSGFLYSPSLLWLISAYVWGISQFVTRIVLFVSYERKENMRLMQSWWGSTVFLVPKPPTINTNCSEMAAK